MDGVLVQGVELRALETPRNHLQPSANHVFLASRNVGRRGRTVNRFVTLLQITQDVTGVGIAVVFGVSASLT